MPMIYLCDLSRPFRSQAEARKSRLWQKQREIEERLNMLGLWSYRGFPPPGNNGAPNQPPDPSPRQQLTHRSDHFYATIEDRPRCMHYANCWYKGLNMQYLFEKSGNLISQIWRKLWEIKYEHSVVRINVNIQVHETNVINVISSISVHF